MVSKIEAQTESNDQTRRGLKSSSAKLNRLNSPKKHVKKQKTQKKPRNNSSSNKKLSNRKKAAIANDINKKSAREAKLAIREARKAKRAARREEASRLARARFGNDPLFWKNSLDKLLSNKDHVEVVLDDYNKEKVQVTADDIRKELEELRDIEPKLENVNVDRILTVWLEGATSYNKRMDMYDHIAESAAFASIYHYDYDIMGTRILIRALYGRKPMTMLEVSEVMSGTRLITGRDAQGNVVTAKVERDPGLKPYMMESLSKVIRENAELIESHMRYDMDNRMCFMGFKTLLKTLAFNQGVYPVERFQHVLMRVSLGIHTNDVKRALVVYNLMSDGYFTHATPTMMQSGTSTPQMSSCFLLSMTEDSIEGIYDTLKRCALISKSAGGIGINMTPIRARGSLIRGTNGVSNGISPMLRVYNATARYVDQGGGKRRGAFAIYLEPWHGDVMEFLEMRTNGGREDLKSRDLFQGLWMPDLLYKRVEEDGNWSLFCPTKAPKLMETYGSEFDKAYVEYENTKGLAMKTMKARELWVRIATSLIETGMPYILNKGACNQHSPQNNLGTIKCSNLCVSGDTKILTKTGYVDIESVVDQKMDIWNGFEFSNVDIKKTGSDQKLVRIKFSNGAHLDCTPYHKFYVSKKYSNKSKDAALSDERVTNVVEAKDLKIGMKMAKFNFPVIRETQSGSGVFPYPYTHGFFCGDGTYGNVSEETHKCANKAVVGGYCMRHVTLYEGAKDIPEDNGGNVCKGDDDGIYKAIVGDGSPILYLYGEKKKLLDHIERTSEAENGNRIVCCLSKNIMPKYKVPLGADMDTRLRWFEGLCDSDGTVAKNGSTETVQIGSIHKEFINDVRMMLSTMGVDSKVSLARVKGTHSMPDGRGSAKDYLCQDLYRLVVATSEVVKLFELGFEPKRLKFDRDHVPNRSSTHFVKITGMEDIEGKYDTFCFNEPLKHTGVFNGVMTSQCSEIVEYTDANEVAVCNLASIALPRFVVNGVFDHKKLYEITCVVTRNLNRIIDVNYYPIEEARTSNMRHRPIGIGIQGLATAFIKNGYGFGTAGSKVINREAMETIYYAALKTSCELAKEEGPYESYKGSMTERGILQPDSWGVKPSDRWDWASLRADIAKYGVRNSLLVAIMPTASSAQLFDNSEGPEPYTSFIQTRKLLAGEFPVVDRQLVNDLIGRGLWTFDVRSEIIRNGGSVTGLSCIPQDLQEKYVTAWDVKMTTMADMALERGWFVDQSQSFSAFMKEPNLRQLSNYIRYGFKIGLKTIIYYLRVRPAADADNIMVDAYDKRKEKQDNLKRSRSVESTELAVDISTADSSEDQLVDSNSSDDNLSHKSKKSKKDSNNNSNNEETIEVTNPLLSSPDTALVGIDPVKPNAPSKRRREALASRAAPRRKLDFESSMQDKRKDDNNDDDDDNQSNSCSLTRGCIPCGT